MANDEEHARMLAEAREKAPDSGEQSGWRPAMHSYTDEVQAIHWVVNELRGFRRDFVNANRDPKKSSPAEAPPMLQAPATALDRIAREMKKKKREERHARLVSKLLPNGPQLSNL